MVVARQEMAHIWRHQMAPARWAARGTPPTPVHAKDLRAEARAGFEERPRWPAVGRAPRAVGERRVAFRGGMAVVSPQCVVKYASDLGGLGGLVNAQKGRWRDETGEWKRRLGSKGRQNSGFTGKSGYASAAGVRGHRRGRRRAVGALWRRWVWGGGTSPRWVRGDWCPCAGGVRDLANARPRAAPARWGARACSAICAASAVLPEPGAPSKTTDSRLVRADACSWWSRVVHVCWSAGSPPP
eukprot:scaffold15774_cov94-Isochrysis_galbana.AAC.4